jgi:protein tyrosine/serine phosphatase
LSLSSQEVICADVHGRILFASAIAGDRLRNADGLSKNYTGLAQLPVESREALWRSDPEYISAALDSIDREYGSVEVYVERELSVSKAEVRALRAKLLQ